MNYTLLTQKDLEARYSYSPSGIKAFFDSKDANLKINKICEDNHILDDEKKIMVFQLAGMVLLGVLHIDDLAGEIDKYLSLNNYKFSKAFAEEITKKIFEPVRAEIEKNYRPISSSTAKNLETQSGATAVKMTPTAPVAGNRPVSLGELQSKDAFAKPLTPPNFSPAPKPSAPAFKPTMPPQKTTVTPPLSASLNTFQSKNPPLDLSQKHAVATGLPQTPTLAVPAKPASTPAPQPVKLEVKKESPPPESVSFGIGDQIKMFDKSQNELVEVLKKREETAPTGPAAPQPQTPLTKPQPAPVPSATLKQAPVMIHQETASQPIRPNTDFKLNFPQVKPLGSFSQKVETPNIAKIEIGGTTERQLEGMVKSSVIQPPKVVHYNAFQTPVDKPLPTPPQPVAPVKPQIPTGTPFNQMSQSPFVKTGKNGYGDMRMEPAPFASTPKAPMSPSTPPTTPQKIKTVDFVDDSLTTAKPKKGWFASLFGKKETPVAGIQKTATPPTMPANRPIPPVAPPAPKPQASAINIQNIGNFAGAPKEQLSPSAPKTQDIKPQNSTMKDADVIDLNTFQIKK